MSGVPIQWVTEKRLVSQLRDFPDNPRKFTEKGIRDLTDSLNSLGYIDPIAINQDGTIIGGHARKDVMTRLGLTEVDVRVPDRQLSDAQVREAIIRLNKNSAGEWDFQKLEDSFERSELLQWGFEDTELGSKNVGLCDADDVPPVPQVAVTQLGDTWILGEHRLRCGDSTSTDCVASLLAGGSPNLMVTDPPYGVEYDAAKARAGSFAKGKVQNDDRADWSEAWALFPGNIAYVWHADKHCGEVFLSLVKTGFTMRAQIIWAKSAPVFGRGNYHYQHEPCFYAVRKKGDWHGDRRQSTIWNIDKPIKSETGHSTQKPIECMRRPIENNSAPGDAVYDPFCGSGTTLIAAEMTGRRCYAMEIEPLYCDMTVMRWQAFTGKQAVLEATGAPFVPIEVAA